jgi:cell division protein FtsI/penicillin-binding protein 2
VKRSAFFFIFLFLPQGFWVLPIQADTAESLPQTFFEQVRKEVDQAIRKRSGLVLWIDRKNHSTFSFGDLSLQQEKFPPGSLMKLITAQAALRKGLSFHYHCVGHDEIEGKKYTCWTYKGHGDVDLPRALALSCNLFFARLGSKIGLEPLLQELKSYGFSPESLNLELPKFAIGDSPAFRVSPLEIAEFWDQYLDFIQKPEASGIKQGLLRAVEEGTASRAGVKGMEILGKTGTADSLRTGFATDGWFLAATPADQPRFALVIFLREAHGFDEPAGLAKKIFLLAKKLGVVE